MEHCDTPVCITVGVRILFLTKILNFLFDTKELISLIVLLEKFNFSKS
jgi:hypothetical protein